MSLTKCWFSRVFKPLPRPQCHLMSSAIVCYSSGQTRGLHQNTNNGLDLEKLNVENLWYWGKACTENELCEWPKGPDCHDAIKWKRGKSEEWTLKMQREGKEESIAMSTRHSSLPCLTASIHCVSPSCGFGEKQVLSHIEPEGGLNWTWMWTLMPTKSCMKLFLGSSLFTSFLLQFHNEPLFLSWR